MFGKIGSALREQKVQSGRLSIGGSVLGVAGNGFVCKRYLRDEPCISVLVEVMRVLFDIGVGCSVGSYCGMRYMYLCCLETCPVPRACASEALRDVGFSI